MKRKYTLGLLVILLVSTLMFMSQWHTKTPEEIIEHREISTLRTNYDAPEAMHHDSDGNLLVPFDIAYPHAFYNGSVSYDETTVHLKLLASHPGILSDSMEKLGLTGLSKIFGDSKAVWYEATIDEDKNIHDVMQALRKHREVLTADYNYQVKKMDHSVDSTIFSEQFETPNIFDTLGISDNPLSSNQWYLSRYGIPEAWEWMVSQGYPAGGSEDVVVAVIDTGVDYLHPDLQSNMWVNTAEIPGNGIDDDGNGIIDDIHGASFISDSRFWNGDPMDDHGHGTHVAGIIAADNNKEGIIGIAHNVKIMAVKAGMSSGFFSSTSIAKAIEYAYMQGADVINMSFGGSLPSIAVQDALMNAYTTSVLVASAGNAGLPNEYCAPFPVYQPNYPAALSYVIGVMSVGSSNQESSFSNWDCKKYNNREYEINAPGESMMSTLPNGQYVSWNGTSMAAPVVSAIAALVRTVYNDRDVYPNKFIMGQVNSATSTSASSALGRPIHNIPPVVDAYMALTSLPKPEVTLYDYYIYDSKTISPNNNGDGIIDAGETIHLGIVVRNRWGKSSNTVVSINTETPMGQEIDEINILTNQVFFGDVGTYSTKDFLTREGSIVKGVEVPHVITIPANAPNDYIARLNIEITYENALDPLDENQYISNDSILLTIRNGVLLPNRVTEDMTLTKDNYYIIPNSMLIESGATVTVQPGTQIQFWSDDPNDAYADNAMVYLQVKGRFIVEGTFEEPVKLFPSQLRDRYEVRISTLTGGYVSIKYAEIINPNLYIDYLGYSYVTQNYVSTLLYRELYSGIIQLRVTNARINTGHAEYNEFRLLGDSGTSFKAHFNGVFTTNLFTENNATFNGYYENNVFLTNNNLRYQGGSASNINASPTSRFSVGQIYTNETTGRTYIAIDKITYGSFITVEPIRQLAQSLGGDLAVFETDAERIDVGSRMTGYVGLKYNYELENLEWINGEAYQLSLPFYYGESEGGYYYFFGDRFVNAQSNRYVIIEVPSQITVNDILSSVESIDLDLESTYALQSIIDVDPYTSEISTLIYHSDDETIATVNEFGVISPLSEGVATIYIYSEDYVVEKSIVVHVVNKVVLSSLSASVINEQMNVNTTQKINVEFNPTHTTEKQLLYSSSNDAIASVSSQGTIIAKAPGQVQITIQNQDGTIFDVISINVVNPVYSLQFSNNIYITSLEKTDVQEDYLPVVYPVDATNQNLIWRSSNPEVAYINELNELVKLKPGVTTLQATAENTNIKSEIVISIEENYQPSEVIKMFEYNDYYIALLGSGEMIYWGNEVSSSKVIKTPFSSTIKDASQINGSYFLILTQTSELRIVYLDATKGEFISTKYNGITDEKLSSITNIVKVESNFGNGSIFMLSNDGYVWSFGNNDFGILGDGTTTSRYQDIVQVGINNVINIAGSMHAMTFLKSNGDAYISGSSYNYTTPTLVYQNVIDIKSVFTSFNIIKTDTVYIWTMSDSFVQGVLNSNQFYVPTHHMSEAYFYIQNGELFSKGYNTYGNLGIGSTDSSNYYQKVPHIENAKNVFVFQKNTFVQTSDYKFYGFGLNNINQLITFDSINRLTPEQIYFGLKGNSDRLILENSNLKENLVSNSTLIHEPFDSPGMMINIQDINNTYQYLSGELHFNITNLGQQADSIHIYAYTNHQIYRNSYYHFSLTAKSDIVRDIQVYVGGRSTTITLSNEYQTFNIPYVPANDQNLGQFGIFLGYMQNAYASNVYIDDLKFTEVEQTHEFYGDTFMFDFNEALVSGSNLPLIELRSVQTNTLVPITRIIDLDRLYLKPSSLLIVGQQYLLKIPSNSISSKFMVANQELLYKFTYMGTHDPNLFTLDERAFFDYAITLNQIGLSFDQVSMLYMNSTYNFTMDFVDTTLGDSLYDLLVNLGVLQIKLNGEETWVSVNEANMEIFRNVLNQALLSNENDYTIDLAFSAEIQRETYDAFFTQLNLTISLEHNTVLYDQLYQDTYNLDMRIVNESHPHESNRHMTNTPITVTFNQAAVSTYYNDIRLLDQDNNEVESIKSFENNILTITPTLSLNEGATYTLVIPEGAFVDGALNVNRLYESTFSTYEPLLFIRSSIDNEQVNVNLKQEIRYFFNYAQLGINFDLISVVDDLGNPVTVQKTLSNNVLSMKPSSSFVEGTTYTITIPQGALQDELGIQNEMIQMTFTTIDKEDRFYFTSQFILLLQEKLIVEGKNNTNFVNNAFLNNFTETNVNYWLRLTANNDLSNSYGMHGNFFGTYDDFIINKHFIDFDIFQSLADIVAGETSTPPENTFPYVVDVQIYDANWEQHYSYGNETVHFVVTFNRDMETSVPLDFRFGSSLPYAEYKIYGEYIDARTWVGTYELRSFVESGNQYFNIQNGYAKDQPWLKLGWDVKRFTFIYDTTSAQAMTLQATSNEEGIHLSWMQDDFVTIAGYNIYRSTSQDGTYTRINSTIIPYNVTTLSDHDVQPGVIYYYYFTVVLTDFDATTGAFKESKPSGMISLRAMDTLKPNVYHTPVYQTYAERNLLINATIIDNVAVAEAFVYFRVIGETTYRKVTMNSLNNRYTGIISAMYVTLAGIEYYIEASDGTSTQAYGTAIEPIQVTVIPLVNEDAKGDVNADGIINVIDALMVLRAINNYITLDADQMMRADLNADGILSAAEALRILQYSIGKVTTLNMPS